MLQMREERKEQAEEMAKLWKADPEEWLRRSKEGWKARHEQVRAKRKVAEPAKPIRERAAYGSQKVGPTSKPGRSAISLKMIVEAGLMETGKDKLFITYMNQTWRGELGEDGNIHFEGNIFQSPSAWAIHCKRKTNPEKRADDGWKSVRYGEPLGPMLEHLKQEYEKQRRAAAGDGAADTVSIGCAASDGTAGAGSDAAGTGAGSSLMHAEADGASTDMAINRGVKGKAGPPPPGWAARFPKPTSGRRQQSPGHLLRPGEDFSAVIGRTVEVFCGIPQDKHDQPHPQWWLGKVTAYSAATCEGEVTYATGDVEQGMNFEELAQGGELNLVNPPLSSAPAPAPAPTTATDPVSAPPKKSPAMKKAAGGSAPRLGAGMPASSHPQPPVTLPRSTPSVAAPPLQPPAQYMAPPLKSPSDPASVSGSGAPRMPVGPGGFGAAAEMSAEERARLKALKKEKKKERKEHETPEERAARKAKKEEKRRREEEKARLAGAAGVFPGAPVH